MSGGFDDLGLMPELIRAINEMGWNLPTDVQDESIPLILTGGDVMVAAETGSGKTAAFVLPMIQCVHERLRAAKAEGKGKKAEKPSDAAPALDVKLNPNDRDPFCDVLENGNACFSANKNWNGIRGSHGIRGGCYFYECTIKGDGICRVGWSTTAASFNLGTDGHGFGYGGTGKKSSGGKFVEYGSASGVTFGDGDTVTCFLDLIGKTRTVSFAKNGEHLGVAFELPASHAGSAFYPAVVVKGAGVRVHFGAAAVPVAAMPQARPMNSATPDDISASSAGAGAGASSSSGGGKGSGRSPVAIIIEPSRELAEQVYNETCKLLQHVREPSLNAVLVVGGNEGHDAKRTIQQLHQGVDIVIGTPGKLNDLVSRNVLSLGGVRHFILDEADRFTADAENLKIILAMYQRCTPGTAATGNDRLQVCFFSATLHSPDITALSEQICERPTWVDLKGVDSVPESVHHVIYRVDVANDAHYLADNKSGRGGKFTPSVTDGLHEKHRPGAADAGKGGANNDVNSQIVKEVKQQILIKIIDKFQMSQCLIFCRTNVDCNSLEQFLIAHGGGQKFRADAETGKENPYSCCVLAGMRSNNERRASLEAFKEGRVRFLICTDVAARGIDIKSLPYVINMTLPDITEVESYIHRIGRVGRADKVGLAVSIVTPLDCNERVWYHSNCNKKQNCMNRKLLEEGGCTKWHTENATIRAIEKRLASVLPNGLPSLTPITFDLPEIYKKLDQVYGEQQTTSLAPGNVAQNNRIAMNTNKVAELRQLEIRVTRDFLAAQQKYNAVVGRPGAAAGKTGGATRESGSSSPKKKQKI